eukprot:7387487-Prymnesium_polylepis.2
MTPSTESRLATASEFVDETLVFKDSKLGKEIVISGALLQPCNPTLVPTADGTIQWELGVFSLDVMMTCLWDTAKAKFYRHGESHADKK